MDSVKSFPLTVSENRNIDSIQYLRGVAALMVVFCHCAGNLTNYPGLAYIFSFGQIGVHIFFLISGFIITHSLTKHNYRLRNFFVFMAKRSIRIDPAYITVIILTLVLFNILSLMPSFKGQNIPFISAQFFSHIGYIIPFTKYEYYNHVFWTLGIEFQLYILIGLFFFLSNMEIYQAIFLCIFCALSFIHWPKGYYVVFTYAPIFATGIVLQMFYLKKRIFMIILVLIFSIVTCIYFGIFIAVVLLLTCCAILFIKIRIRILKFFGNISYSLYLIHPLSLVVINGLLKRTNINFNQLLLLFIEILFSIAVAFCLYTLIEKPSMRVSKKLHFNNNPIVAY